MLSTPVALFIFTRLETTLRVFSAIAEAKPRRLLVVADGPRPGCPQDIERCAAVRAVIDRVDWPCELLKLYSDMNLGLKRRFSSGLDWVFSRCDEAIVLEDDCLPHATFFRFSEELLARYRDDERILMVSGDNYQFGHRRNVYSYYFSKSIGTYGWATWRRAWAHYDLTMRLWPELRETPWLRDVWGDVGAEVCWRRIFDATYAGEIDTWDYQWALAMWAHGGLQIVPSVNLVSYIGCLPDAVHTTSPDSAFCNLPACPMSFPLLHPPYVVRDREADQFEFAHLFAPQPSGAPISGP